MVGGKGMNLDILEKTLKLVNYIFRYAGVKYWLGFGGLWGLVKNDGVIPDGDLDLCAFYGADWRKLIKCFQNSGYTLAKALLNDTDRAQCVYCGFNREGYPHICVSFWYPHNGIRYYCHDQHHEVTGEGVPPAGYFFKGVPECHLEHFRMVEWPGIRQDTKISVPRLPGALLDYSYPDWAYQKQRYNILKHEIDKEHTVSVFKGGAISPYMVHVKSMAQWGDAGYINQQIEAGKVKWLAKLKELGK